MRWINPWLESRFCRLIDTRVPRREASRMMCCIIKRDVLPQGVTERARRQENWWDRKSERASKNAYEKDYHGYHHRGIYWNVNVLNKSSEWWLTHSWKRGDVSHNQWSCRNKKGEVTATSWGGEQGSNKRNQVRERGQGPRCHFMVH